MCRVIEEYGEPIAQSQLVCVLTQRIRAFQNPNSHLTAGFGSSKQ
jgi:hypothetical protein